jgi:uncharacterized protein (DUF2252 family)
MAADLAEGPSSGIEVMCGGDAHLANFGIYASPQRTLIFDLNDFDEAAVAPAEWDVKRLTTSTIVAGRHAGYPDKTIRRIAYDVVRTYRDGLHAALDLDILSRYYLRVEPERYVKQVSGSLGAVLAAAAKKAKTRTSERVFERIMQPQPDGRFTLRENPPLLTHVDIDDEARLTHAFRQYLTSVPADVAVVLSHFQLSDIARRVVGVGSVGTRAYLLILIGPDGTPLVLQVKEANRSVLEEYGRWPQPETLLGAARALGQGIRVIGGQRILQAISDVFLGHLRIDDRDFYVRQFQDMKGSVEIAGMNAATFGQYAGACAYALARGHSQSANASLLRGYTGSSDAIDAAIVDWSYAYADKTLADFDALRNAAQAGDIEVAPSPLT